MHTNLEIAQQRGYRYALKGTIYTELTVLLIFISFIASATKSFNLIKQFIGAVSFLNIINFIILTFIFAYFLGKKAGQLIIMNRANHFLIGYKTGFLIVLCSTLTASIIALLVEFSKGELPVNWLIIFIIQPFVWLFCASLIPIFISGTWYGYQLIKINDN